MISDDLLFYLFTNFSPLPHGPKITRLLKIQIPTWKYPLSEVNVSPRWVNTLGHVLLESMADYPVCFTMITNIISSYPSPHMVVPFVLVPLDWQSQYQARYGKRGQTTTQKHEAQIKS